MIYSTESILLLVSITGVKCPIEGRRWGWILQEQELKVTMMSPTWAVRKTNKEKKKVVGAS
ncbi:hypothetical protein BDR03DRAFT_967847, partial [Suillus americanus]